MKPATKTIIAREFLILMGVVVITALSWLTIYLFSTNTYDKYSSSILSLRSEKSKLDSLEKNNPNPKLYWTPPSDIVFEKLPVFPEGDWELILDKYKSFEQQPDISNNLDDYCQARQNLMEIHKAILSTDDEKFYQDNREFNNFISNLDKKLLTKIHNGITGKSKDYERMLDIPKNFNSFLINIGYDTVNFRPLINKQISDYERSVENCKQNIITQQNEQRKIEASSFLHLDIMRVVFIVFLILFGLAFPIRGLIKMTFWAFKTLQNEK